MKKVIALTALAAACGSAMAQITIDGQKDALYNGGNYQTNPTGFGNSTLGLIDQANGSELDGAVAEFGASDLYLLFLGNLETNFNKLDVFIDIDGSASGQNVLRNDNPDVDFNQLNRMAGLTFDSGFAPDYWFRIAGGLDGGVYRYFVNWAQLSTNGGGQGGYMGSGTYGSNGALTGGTDNGVRATINNSNTGGVDSSAVNNPSLVTTGIEWAIPLSLIGNPTWGQGIRVAAFINGSGGDFLSNQVLGGAPSGTGNFGDPSNVNFNNVAGNQFFVVPEPGTMIALGLGLAGIAARRRRK